MESEIDSFRQMEHCCFRSKQTLKSIAVFPDGNNFEPRFFIHIQSHFGFLHQDMPGLNWIYKKRIVPIEQRSFDIQ